MRHAGFTRQRRNASGSSINLTSRDPNYFRAHGRARIHRRGDQQAPSASLANRNPLSCPGPYTRARSSDAADIIGRQPVRHSERVPDFRAKLSYL